MKNKSTPPTSQDRKHGQDHGASNPRAVKDIPTAKDRSPADNSWNADTAALMEKRHPIKEDKRKTARQEHTNLFTNRASDKK